MDSDLSSYARTPYPDVVQPFAHPSLAFGAAHLYGHSPSARARKAPRVLDIGCNRGAQLRWIARTLPNSVCLGLDGLEQAVAEARALDNPPNLSFEHGDLSTWDPGERRFDLVIAYGMLSWVPDPVREALLHLIARVLAPGGIALVCWIALPGGAATEALGQLLRLEQARVPDPDVAPDTIERGPAEAMRRLGEGMHRGLAGPSMNGALIAAQRKNAGLLAGDDLNRDRRGFYLMEVLDAAAQSGLRYLGDVELWPDWIAGGPSAVAPALDGLPHLVALQYRDYLLNVSFRRSLFVAGNDAASLETAPDPLVAWRLYPVRLTASEGAGVSLSDPVGADGEMLLKAIGSGQGHQALSRLVARSALPDPKNKARWGLAALRLAANQSIALSLGPAPV